MKIENGLYTDLSNADYHAEVEHLSSSSFKSLLHERQAFYEQKILGIAKVQKESSVFDEGSYLHSLILEPEKTKDEFAFYPGWRKAGAEFDAFKAGEGAGKTILSKPQKVRADKWFEFYDKRPEAKSLIKGCQFELSLFLTLSDIQVKVRADAINVDKGYIVDVKTTGFDIDVDSFKTTMTKFGYPLSSALYLRAFELYFKKPFEFYFIVVGKKDLGCHVYKLSEETRFSGEQELNAAFKVYKDCVARNDWTELKTGDTIETESEYEIQEV